jgi:hypothetical protein
MNSLTQATGETMASNGPTGQAASDSAANDNRTAEPDFDLHDHGSIVVLVPRSAAAAEWRAEHLPEDAMEWAGGVAIERRYVPDILDGIAGDGLTVAM